MELDPFSHTPIHSKPKSAVFCALFILMLSGCLAGGASSIPTSFSPKISTQFKYVFSSVNYIVGVSIPGDAIQTNASNIIAYSISPSLPDGLEFNITTGEISGTPHIASPETTYTVLGSTSGSFSTTSNSTTSTTSRSESNSSAPPSSNSNHSSNQIYSTAITITVSESGPSSLTYSTTSGNYIAGSTIPLNIPSYTGGTPLYYSIVPALPTGLTLDPTSGVIQGTPIISSSTTLYTITGENNGGSISTTISITVTDYKPSNLNYSQSSATYSQNSSIGANIPSNSGGTITSYSVSPSLPSGLTLDPITGYISGTPKIMQDSTTYSITGSNQYGSTKTSISIQIVSAAPNSLIYSSMTAHYYRTIPITSNIPSNSGGTIINYFISPNLPLGLTLNSTTGIISGTPQIVSPETRYLVTGTNAGGSAAVSIIIAVNETPPTSLSYAINPVIYIKGVSINSNLPTSSGGPISNYSSVPDLPLGLILDSTSGIINGTPSLPTSSSSYVITGSNSGGSTKATLNITVNDIPPTNLSYTNSSALYYRGISVSNLPTNSDGTITNYSISPSLPGGLTINSSTGIISGIPTTLSSLTTYNITGTNSGGSTNTTILITVSDTLPTNLTYSTNAPIFSRGIAGTTVTPSNTGGLIVSYSITPTLPSGLSINSSTGIISGTPTNLSDPINYIVSGSNAAGTATTGLTLSINDLPPANLNYTPTSLIITYGSSPTMSPNFTGGTPIDYKVNPSLPIGLTLNSTTGIISGSPTNLSPTTNYVVSASNTGGTATTTLSITIIDFPPTNLSYSYMAPVYSKNSATASNYPNSSGGAIVSYSISPTLPSGITLNSSSGIISGTPSVAMIATPYVVTGANSGGKASATLNITVNDTPPTSLSYSNNNAIYYYGTSINPNVPSNSGGTITTYTISPSLPLGLSIDSSTGILSGTPKELSTSTLYYVTGINSGGSTYTSMNITVENTIPTNLIYGSQSAVYSVGTPISSNTPHNSGGLITTYSVSPDLPTGLILNTQNGIISGTPTSVKTVSNYLVTGTNSIGSVTSTLSITVNDIPPSALSYTYSSQTFTKGTDIPIDTPSSSGGAITNYTISPALPNGITINSSSGLITGTPTILSTAINYTVTASNSGGSTTAILIFEVNDVPPSNLSYIFPSPTYMINDTISNNSPTADGGAVTRYSISPTLPSGLSLNSSSGIISGTPIVARISTPYVVAASNSGGSALATLNITVNDYAPTALSYSFSNPTYVKGLPISQNVPSNSGGTIISYSSSPTLPSGLTMNSSTGVISGTPTTVITATPYVITGTNSGGSTTSTITITINDTVPYSLNYSQNPATYMNGSLITSNIPSNLGGTIINYSVSPALPSGLSINSSTGIISGTPTTFFTTPKTFVVTGMNSGGVTSVNLIITINDAPPASLSYTYMAPAYTKGTPISLNTPTSSGGAVTSYIASSSLPSGLTLNSTNGIISGTPNVVSIATPYVITAINSGGTISATLNITVNDIAPSSLTYSTMSAIYVRGATIADNIPSSSGGTILSYSASPTLPKGLTLNSTSGIISGVPSDISASTNYVITASNSGGSATATLNFSIADYPPTDLAYSSMIAYYSKSIPISNNIPSNSGGTIMGYSVSPLLPSGLSLNSSNGIISGTPTTVQSVTTYVVKGTNLGGSASATLQITINDAPPTLLTYSSMNLNYVKGIPIINNTPSNSGGVITSYSVFPSLPSGLTINSSTGVISGTPTSIVPSANYTVNGSNISGSAYANLTIAVNDVVPSNLTYTQMSPMYTIGTTITNNLPSASGGVVISYSITPSLPAGLIFDTSTGIISGTPTAISISTPYVVTATNSGGSTSATLNITSTDIPPSSLSYSDLTAVYTKGILIASNSPSSTGGTVISYTSSPTLPSGLTLNSSTGVISGIPTAVTSAANYTITAMNSGGSATAILNLTVKDIAPANLTYSSNPVTYIKTNAIGANIPSNSGGTIISYTVTPSLPLGLVFNSSTGIISGTPTTITATNNYVAIGTNTGGSVSATLNITVNDSAPSSISYSYSSYQFLKGATIVALSATYTGGTPTSYSVNPSLPTGLSINGTTGLLSGTPSTNTAPLNYVITGSNVTGSANATLNILVTQTEWIGNISSSTASGATSGCGSASIGTFTPGWCTGGTASSGNSDGKMNSPSGTFEDSNGYLYVTDTSNHRINKYDVVLGTFIGWLGRVSTSPSGGASGCSSAATGAATPGWCTGGTSQSGTSDGAFSSPAGITGDGTYLYIVDQGNFRIVKYNASSGAYLGWAGLVGTRPTGGASGCTSLSAGSYTNLWCTGGASSQATSSPINGGFNLGVGTTIYNGNLYVVDQSNSTLNKYTASTGAFTGWIGKVGGTRPTGGASGCTANSNKNGYTVGWCTGGSSSTGNGDGSFNLPAYVANDTTYLYVSNTTSDQIGKYDMSSGSFIGWIGKVNTIPSGGVTGCTSATSGLMTPGWCTGGSSTAGTGDGMFTNPSGLAVNSTSAILYIADAGNNRLMKVNSSTGSFSGWSGKILTSPTGGDSGCSGASVGTGTLGWCTGGTAQSGTGNVMFNTPSGISLDKSGNLLISDYSNSRVVKLIP